MKLGNKKKRKKALVVITVVVSGLVLAGFFLTNMSATPTEAERIATSTAYALVSETRKAVVFQTREAEPTRIPAPICTLDARPLWERHTRSTPVVVTTFAPGTYIVGKDIQPGTYQGQAGDDILGSCYWARLSGLDGELGSILANTNAIGQFYVKVKATDYAFQTACTLERVDD